MSLFSGLRPDITPAQLAGVGLAGIPVLANLLHAFGVYTVSPDEQRALGEAVTWGSVSAGALFVSDAGLRGVRNQAAAKMGVAPSGSAGAEDDGPPPLNAPPVPPTRKK